MSLSKLHILVLRNNSVVYINDKRFKKDTCIFIIISIEDNEKKIGVNWTVHKNIFLVAGAKSPCLK